MKNCRIGRIGYEESKESDMKNHKESDMKNHKKSNMKESDMRIAYEESAQKDEESY